MADVQPTHLKNKILMIGLEDNEADAERWPHMTGDQLKAAMHGEVEKLTAEGYMPTLCFVQPETAEKTIEGLLSAVNFDCVLIGAGVRADPKEVTLFEQLINTVHVKAPMAMICFNTCGTDSLDAVKRWLPPLA